MTPDIATPAHQFVKAIDVRPYRWGVWCTIGDRPTPFVNVIESCRWSEDGRKIWWMLGTHNTQLAAPEEMVELVPIPRGEWESEGASEEAYQRFLKERPILAVTRMDAGAGCEVVAEETSATRPTTMPDATGRLP